MNKSGKIPTIVERVGKLRRKRDIQKKKNKIYYKMTRLILPAFFLTFIEQLAVCI